MKTAYAGSGTARETGTPAEYHLAPDEAAELLSLAAELRTSALRPVDPVFYDQHWPSVDRLPSGLRGFLRDFRHEEAHAAVLVHGLSVDDALIGPTPEHWEIPADDHSSLDQEIILGLCAMALGEPQTWATLQAGRMVQNIIPISGNEKRQNGHSSDVLLEFHTEDGFHPRRCDYLLLMGLRNHDRVPTTVASVRDLVLSDEVRAVLAQERFAILPDDEHIRQLTASDPTHPALARAIRMRDEPTPVAVLFGDRAAPYLRIDRPFMHCAPGDVEAERALDALMAELLRVQRDVVVGPGTLLVVDNYQAVHGRRPFPSRYDGADRWLKKITAGRDLRRHASDDETRHPRVLL
ncbi:guanitoxin biosynthesis L-enduracididine beta-hydroxylase GntD [Umezawaea sp. NPDC059074]|uniref:guanitoxin biosynthesis L-enduracididine beta-hydroxylase GntD n=1 Tax=Umezawaea sp. NPDC059074 TaxID=3346716 RepID=UPI00369E0C49